MQKFDTAIIGGGMVGLTMAIILARARLKIAVIDSADLNKTGTKEFDGRVSAITLASRHILENNGIWKYLAEEAEPINHIRISDSDSHMFLDYDAKLIGDEPMGHIVENRYIRRALFAAAAEHSNLEIFAPAIYEKVAYNSSHVEISLAGHLLKAKLLIAADGKKSKIAAGAGIKPLIWDYGQDGIVCTVRHEKPHGQTACERFLPAGPFAILPMKGGYHSSLVWTEKRMLTPFFMKMDRMALTAEVKKRFGSYLGELEVLEPRFSFPLSLYHAERYIDHRLALIGDAAHSIHPVAGQGLNLGIRDAAVLGELIAKQQSLGLDTGSLLMLEKYQNLRKADNLLMMSVTDGLNHLFSNNITPIKLARRFGMSAVNKMPPVKKFFMLHAVGKGGIWKDGI